MNQVYIKDEEYKELLLHVEQLVDEIDKLPHPNTKDLLHALLQHIDMFHREGLSRLFKSIENKYPDLKVEMENDAVVKSLFSLYDLFDSEFVADDHQNGKMNTFIPIENIDVITKIKRPIWIPGGNISDLLPGKLISKDFEGVKVLLCKVNDEVFAMHNTCYGSVLPLDLGKLKGYNITCPWHNCVYDVRSGSLKDSPDKKLEKFHVTVEESGRFLVGFNI